MEQLRLSLWRNLVLVALFWVLTTCDVLAQAPAHSDDIVRLNRALVLDSKMGDPGWSLATTYRDFVTLQPEAGKPPSERTEVHLAYTATTLYVGIRSFDSDPGKIRSTAASVRDAWKKDDWVAFCLNPYDDALNSLYFFVTPNNLRSSGIRQMDDEPRYTVTMNWTSRTSTANDGWIAEMAIPLTSLAYEGSTRVAMSFKVARFISRKGEEVDFPRIDADRLEGELYREIELRDVVASPVSASDAYQKGLENLRQDRLRRHHLPYQQQLDGWDDASTLDYLTFNSRDLKPSPHPLHFQRSAQTDKVARSLESMEYAPGQQVGNLERFLTRSGSSSFIVIKDDAVLYEGYFNGYKRDSVVTSFSAAKSFVSTLVGIAIDERKIASVNDPVTKYLPELVRRDSRFEQITIRDLLSMSSGIRYREDEPYKDNDVTYHDADLGKAALEKTVVSDVPGQHWHYNNYHPLLLGMILERVTGDSVTAYLQKKLWTPLGMEYAGSWSVNGDGSGLEKMESGINGRAIDFAKLGRLMLERGRWDGAQIVSASWVDEATQPQQRPTDYFEDQHFFGTLGHYYSYFWWGSKRPNGENDFSAVGNKGQYIYVSPQKNVIIVRNGFDFGIPTSRWLRLFYQLADKL